MSAQSALELVDEIRRLLVNLRYAIARAGLLAQDTQGAGAGAGPSCPNHPAITERSGV